MNDMQQLIIVYVLLRLCQDVDPNFDIVVSIYNERLYMQDGYIDEQDLKHFDKKLELIARKYQGLLMRLARKVFL
jgi:hypothetical protein